MSEALEAIRAFIERVEKRLPDYNTGKGADSWLKAYRLAAYDELAAMELDEPAPVEPDCNAAIRAFIDRVASEWEKGTPTHQAFALALREELKAMA